MLDLRGDPRTRRPSGLRLLSSLGLAIVLVVVTVACGTSGRNMATPVPGATAPPRRPDPTASTVAGPDTEVTSPLFTLTSAGFAPGGEIPTEYTCDNVGNAPPFSWANLPPGTVEVALVISDPDANDYTHWLVSHIDPAITGLGPRFAPQGAVEVTNSGGTPAYVPLCPPAGETHNYEFTLYALDKPSGLTAQSDLNTALTSLAVNATGTAVLTGYYTRNTAN